MLVRSSLVSTSPSSSSYDEDPCAALPLQELWLLLAFAFADPLELPLLSAAAFPFEACELAALFVALELENPHPCFPAWKAAPGPEHIPHGRAQQFEAQSALERHWPPINWPPLPLPMFFVPAGSKGGQRLVSWWVVRDQGVDWSGFARVSVVREREVRKRSEAVNFIVAAVVFPRVNWCW